MPDALLQNCLEALEVLNSFLEGEWMVIEHEHLQSHQLVQEVPIVDVVFGTVIAHQSPLLTIRIHTVEALDVLVTFFAYTCPRTQQLINGVGVNEFHHLAIYQYIIDFKTKTQQKKQRGFIDIS